MATEHRFLRACRNEPTDCTPVWFMRQAGRYMSEYRALRTGRTFLDMSTDPAIAAEVTLQPVRAFPALDAAIIFADIMTPLGGIGIDFDIAPGVGPVVAQPLRDLEALRALRPFDAERSVGFLLEAIERVVRELAGQVPLIGFAGAPFTLACYIIQGQASRDFTEARRVMYAQPELWNGLMTALTDMVITYLRAQVRAGAQAVQLFDSWVGLLGPREYVAHVQPYMRRIFDGLADLGVPRIHFGTGTASLLEVMAEAGGDVIGLDWRVSIADARRRLGPQRAVQGNLDPTTLLAPLEVLEREMHAVLADAGGRPGHIFNVGHGIQRQTDPERVRWLAQAVHDATRRGG